MHRLHEKHESLWLLTIAPLLWAAHFLLSYVTAAIWCAKMGGSFDSVRAVIFAYTIIALIGIGMTGWIGYRRHSLGTATVPHDADTPEDRHRFLGFATLLLAGLSAVATIFAALTIVFIRSCD